MISMILEPTQVLENRWFAAAEERNSLGQEQGSEAK